MSISPDRLHSPEFLADPYSIYGELRRDAPVFRVEDPPEGTPGTVYSTGTSWWITRYDDAKAVLKDYKRFVHDFRLAMTPEELEALPPTPPLMAALSANLTGLEPPEHTQLRGLVSQAFARKKVEQMGRLVQGLADDLLAEVETRGEMDLMEDFAYPLPIRVISGMLGVPFEDAPLLRKWAEIKPPSNAAEAEEVMAGLREAKAYVDRQLELRHENPSDDLITGLMEAEIEGERLEEIQLFSMIMMIIVAGFETTVNLIGNGMLALFDNPNQLAKLRARPELAENAVEEMLRFDTPLEHSLTRWVSENTEFRGQQLKRGDRVVVIHASANRDPEKFEDPDRFDIEREELQHISFGYGIHFCLGAPLARVEGPIAFRTLLERLPELELATSRSKVRYRDNLPFRGLQSLPVRWRV